MQLMSGRGLISAVGSCPCSIRLAFLFPDLLSQALLLLPQRDFPRTTVDRWAELMALDATRKCPIRRVETMMSSFLGFRSGGASDKDFHPPFLSLSID